jgi:tRNA(His) 5'-end guanylyltransferase
MANSKYSYVKHFETDDRLLPDCWIVVRVDGKGFTKCAKRAILQHAVSGCRLMLDAACTAVRQLERFMTCRFSALHGFEKPNDAGALALMDATAQVCHRVSSPAVDNAQRNHCTPCVTPGMFACPRR